jgi:hypothetical protein
VPTLRQVAKLTICRHDMITALAVTVQVPETLLWLMHEFGEGT